MRRYCAARSSGMGHLLEGCSLRLQYCQVSVYTFLPAHWSRMPPQKSRIIGGDMNRATRLLLLCVLASPFCVAQVPAGAPAGTTGMCNDGTYTSAASKRGACSGHKGVKQWYATSSTPSNSS